MTQYQKPTKEQVRQWFKDAVDSRKAPPEPIIIREQLWKIKNITL